MFHKHVSRILSTRWGEMYTPRQTPPPPPRQTPYADTPRQTPRQTPPKTDTPLPPQQTATAADGTHPTGMYSCYANCWRFVLDTSACNIDLNVTDTRQYITTVGYPRYYLDNQNCSYTFVAPSGRRILVFFDDVGLEKGYDNVVFRKY